MFEIIGIVIQIAGLTLLAVKIVQLEMKQAEHEGQIWALKTRLDFNDEEVEELRKVVEQHERR